jgi:hypothetical protein
VVEATMRAFAADGFAKCKPGRKKITWRILVALGPDAEWSLDGFDKLNEAGFGIYGIQDKWAWFWLLYVVVPSNWYLAAIGMIFLRCVRKYVGIVINNKYSTA